MVFLLTAALSASHPTIPALIRGEWDLVGHCRVPADGSDSRVIVRATEVVFVETVFTPRKALTTDVRDEGDGEEDAPRVDEVIVREKGLASPPCGEGEQGGSHPRNLVAA